MNSKQLKAHRRRARQKLKKKPKQAAAETAQAPDTPQAQAQSRSLLLNKLVSFDHFTLDSSGFVLRPVRGIVVKCTAEDEDGDQVLTIKMEQDGPASTNKRIEALMRPQEAQDPTLFTAARSALLNFKLLDSLS